MDSPEQQPRKACLRSAVYRSAETVVATRKKSWRLDGHSWTVSATGSVFPSHTLSHPLVGGPRHASDSGLVTSMAPRARTRLVPHERTTVDVCTARRPEASVAYYFPRDLFFCFFTFRLTIGSFAPVPRDTGLVTGCFFDFPAMPILLDRGRVATDDPTLHAV